MGSAAMDGNGNLALGFSASSATIHPQIRYAGRLASDPPSTLAQGEAHLFDGTGSQTDTVSRWGDYSDMTVDPVDDCTFWYTQEYYQTTSQLQLAHAHRELQVPVVHRGASRDARGNRDRRRDSCSDRRGKRLTCRRSVRRRPPGLTATTR